MAAERPVYKQTGLGAFLQRATPLVAPEPQPPPPPPPLPKPTTARSKQILGAPPPTSASVPLSLNPQQKSAAEHAGGLLCVEAGPGSGKTRVIAARVEHLCVAANVPAHRILVLTFSNKAAGELRARVGARARGAMVNAEQQLRQSLPAKQFLKRFTRIPRVFFRRLGKLDRAL
jgi:hypothetical protein